MSTDFEDRLRTARDTLPTPDSTVSATTEQHVLARLPAATREPRRLRMSRRRRLVGAAALVAVALVVGGVAGAELAGSSSGATPPPVTSFQPALGWNTFETNVLADRSQPEVLWAANVPFKPESAETPINTIKSLPPDGIVINVVGPAHYTGNESEPLTELSLPATLSQLHFNANNYEGQWAPNVSEYWAFARVNETQVLNISVWMGRNDPTPAMKAAADEELARLSLPS